jgi:hypothetical protein
MGETQNLQSTETHKRILLDCRDRIAVKKPGICQSKLFNMMEPRERFTLEISQRMEARQVRERTVVESLDVVGGKVADTPKQNGFLNY